MMCSRASSTTMASMRRLTVSCFTPAANSERYGSENCRWRVMRIGSSSVPSAATRLVTTPIGSTDGVSIRMRSCSSRYSWSARCSMTSFAAYTLDPTRMNRTTWREMPRGRATRCSVGHSANGVPQGNGISRESGLAETKRGTCHSLP